MPILSIRNFSIKASGVYLINGLNLSLEAGEVLAIIGPNGAGKSTLINTIINAGLPNQITQGALDVCQQSFNSWLPQDRARRLALLPQSSTLSFPFTVTEVIQMGRIPHSTGKLVDDEIINQALSELDIVHLQNRLYTQLSGGEKQRVQLARVMSQIWRQEDCCELNDESVNKTSQRLLLLDEPSSSLDLGHQQQLMKIIRRFAAQGVGVVFVAHDINLVMSHADKLVALSKGEAIAQGRPSDIVNSSLMKQLYQVDVDVISHPVSGQLIVTPC